MERIKILPFLLWILSLVAANAQSISGNLSKLSNQSIKLEVFNGLKTYPVSTTTIDEKGNFKIDYSTSDYGVGYLLSADEQPFLVVLSGENIEIVGEALSFAETIKVVKGMENQWFVQYAKDHLKREQALSAWLYLEKMYTIDPMFSDQQIPLKSIQTEKQRIKNEDSVFLATLPKDSYVSWYLPARKLVSSVSAVAQYRPEEIPATFAAFRALDYSDPRLYKSGLLKDAIEGHFWLIENSGLSLDSVFMEMKHSIDAMMVNLTKDNKKLNEVTGYLFNLLERHSHFGASEYLALKVLNETSCTIDSDLAKQLESYRAMKIGNIAPEIVFVGDLIAPKYTSVLPKKTIRFKEQIHCINFWSQLVSEMYGRITRDYKTVLNMANSRFGSSLCFIG